MSAPRNSDILQQLARAAQTGWDGIDDPDGTIAAGEQQLQAAVRAEEKRQAKIFLDCFGTPEGKACLALLRQKTIEQPPTRAELDERDPHAFALMQAQRMGATNLVWTIEEALAVARGDDSESE